MEDRVYVSVENKSVCQGANDKRKDITKGLRDKLQSERGRKVRNKDWEKKKVREEGSREAEVKSK